MSSGRRALAGTFALALIALAVRGRADAPVLHEFVELDAAEDLRLGARTPDGRMPAAERTPSGIISAPGFLDPNAPRQIAYGGGATPDSIDATFRLDRDTSEPSVVRYDDPFTPSVAPFKRLYAFDTVDSGLELRVREKRLAPVPVGGELRSGYDRFFGDLFVDLSPGVPVRIPTVGPTTWLLALRMEPAGKLEVVRDAAENLFVVGTERRRVRLILDLMVDRRSFGTHFAADSYEELAEWLAPLPPAASPVVAEVLGRLGLSRALRPRDALVALVAHFRSFSASSELPSADGGVALFRELVLEKKGVCRHRAFGFMLTALGLGLPARFVRNEAHAWVEVRDRELWHRIDLGGAARRFEADTQPGAPAHAVPADPYEWPEGSSSALDAAREGANRAGGAATGSSSDPGRRRSNAPSAAPAGSAASAVEPAPAPTTVSPADSDHPESAVELRVAAADTRRGAAVSVSGAVTSASGNCSYARVDIVLVHPAGESLIGSVPTDAFGRFDSQVTIPFDIDVGEHTLRASTPGAGACGPSR